MELRNMPKQRINNIENLRNRYRKSSLLANRTAEDRKKILYAWRDTFKGQDRDRLNMAIANISLIREGVGELSALEYLFRLTEFVSYVDKFAITTPHKEGPE